MSDARGRGEMRLLHSLRIEDCINNSARGANASETTVRILSTLCEAVMWMLRDWPNEDPMSSCSSSFTESRMKSLAKLRKLLETERPAKNTNTDALFLMLADSIQMMAGQWPPHYGVVNPGLGTSRNVAYTSPYVTAQTVVREQKREIPWSVKLMADEVYDTKASKNGGAKEKRHRKKKRRAFEFYWEEMRSEYAKTHAHMGHNERRAIAQAEWRNVTDRDRWQAQADEYNEKMIETKYKDKPKPPVTANAFFFRENHRVLRQQNPALRGCDVLAEIGKMWEKCEDKSRYIEMQNADRQRYETEMTAYRMKKEEEEMMGVSHGM
ncbi:hypothetical protein PFISCL1PPCAC_15654 [Pristionchus fissidentatus]|uniref:HMG box domain-containing protein n=1 Tax=Pristionchus fissidentatus TaxID=1538716 RepID=A0AAV5W2L5_9BILA|nr:hypothetical protein PFISCL1PPCAC_15654 [Pristionchus fissidentatus]